MGEPAITPPDEYYGFTVPYNYQKVFEEINALKSIPFIKAVKDVNDFVGDYFVDSINEERNELIKGLSEHDYMLAYKCYSIVLSVDDTYKINADIFMDWLINNNFYGIELESEVTL
jgi:hypothetical protein